MSSTVITERAIETQFLSQASCRMDVTRLEHKMSKFTHGEAGGIRCLPLSRLQTLDALGDYEYSIF